MRAATPASILVLAAVIVEVLVTCSTPVIKSLSFLQGKIGGSGNESNQNFALGALGYCIGSTCSSASIGYSFDPTQLLGVATNVEGFNIDSGKYSTAVIKGLTYALVLNPIALAAAVVTLITGLLAHCNGFGLVCINGLFSGIASSIAFFATVINFALFAIAKKRINDVQGASADFGTALWLSLAGWILIVLSSCAFCCGCGGRNGGGSRKRKSTRNEGDDDIWKSGSNRFGNNAYPEQMRMDALQAENDRKKRQQNVPQYAVYETEHIEELPLKGEYDHPTGFSEQQHSAYHQQFTPSEQPYGSYYANGGLNSDTNIASTAHQGVSYHDGMAYGDGTPMHENNYAYGGGTGGEYFANEPTAIPQSNSYQENVYHDPYSHHRGQSSQTYHNVDQSYHDANQYGSGSIAIPPPSHSTGDDGFGLAVLQQQQQQHQQHSTYPNGPPQYDSQTYHQEQYQGDYNHQYR